MTSTFFGARTGVARLGVGLVVVLTALSGCTGNSTDVGTPVAPSAAAPGSGATGQQRADPAKDPALAAFYGQKPSWRDCKQGFECTEVLVPIDWSKPSGATLKLGLIRSHAGGTKIGSLLINPGGPGVAGVNFVRQAAGNFDEPLHAAFDLVGWDPRGVGTSQPIACLPNDVLDERFAMDATPDTPAERAAVEKDAADYAAACQAHTGELLAHVDTISTAKDMDVIRAVLGDTLLSYYGGSYGTFLGAWYAQEFPWRVGRLVLDGAVDPSLDAAGYTEGQALGFSRGVQAYVADCLRQQGCPLRGSPAEAYGQLKRLVEASDAAPLGTTDPKRQLTQALLTTGLAQGMYSRSLWPQVTLAITAALQGDGTAMLALADSYNERDPRGHYDQTLQATEPIFCLDHPETRSVDEIAAQAKVLAAKYPPLGDTIGWGAAGCALWPIKAVVPMQRLTAVGAAPIVVVGSTGDPATPYEWAQSLASQLSSGVLLTRKGQGHTAYREGSACIDTAIDRYLVTGAVPAKGTVCS